MALPCLAQTTVTATPTGGVTQAQVDVLMKAVDRTQAQIDASQRDLQLLRQQLQQMQAQVAAQIPAQGVASPDLATTVPQPAEPSPASSSSAEQASMQASQIATLDQVKVESESKYPLRLTGTVLLNGFVNTGRVDQAAAPSAALGGRGTTGLSVLQTVLGLNADGPRLFGAASHADLRVDFFGSPVAQNYATSAGLLRLRTAHAALDWKHTQFFLSLDRTLLNPEMPESLVAVAQPELAWSGNLWSWNPQVGVTHTFGQRTRFQLQAALIDPADPIPDTDSSTAGASAAASVPSLAERSRRPGVEARVAILGHDDVLSPHLGIGGYFAPHYLPVNGTQTGSSFNAWAATMDYRLPLKHGLVLNGSAYRGQALGGLGGGGYKDYVYSTAYSVVRPLDDIGGWTQLHQQINQRFSWNAGFGLDNAFSGQIRAAGQTGLYNVIARNRTVYANILYSPSAYLLFSVEYRHLYTAPVVGHLWTSNSTGIGAAYRF